MATGNRIYNQAIQYEGARIASGTVGMGTLIGVLALESLTSGMSFALTAAAIMLVMPAIAPVPRTTTQPQHSEAQRVEAQRDTATVEVGKPSEHFKSAA
jgi:galactitol-specific phosphotransferase system IIC component